MKTAKQYLFDVMGCEPVNSRIDYVDAIEALEAAIADAGTLREQVRQGLADYFGEVGFDPLPELPAATPAIKLGEPARLRNVFPPACGRCGQRGADCLCEQPPF